MENIIGFVLMIIALIINIFAAIVSSYILVNLLWNGWRLHDINLFLVINTYIPVFIISIISISLNIDAILGDTNISIHYDLLACQIRGYVYLYMIIWVFDSFSLQAYIRMLNILYPTRTYLHSCLSIIILMIITWFVSFLLVITTIFFQVIIYEPNEYQCTVNLHVWKSNVYMTLCVYLIPLNIVIISYIRVIKYMRESTIRNQQYRQTTIIRDLRIMQRIIILVHTLIILGLPSAIFWIFGLITGQLHTLTFRIQAIFISIDIFFLTFAVALTNPQVKRLIPLFNKHRRTHVSIIHPQQLTSTPV